MHFLNLRQLSLSPSPFLSLSSVSHLSVSLERRENVDGKIVDG